ncbi:hypothetical protein FA95DRAFT_1601144 [Auriscalpium vulgare]|uniref:Uncharacterized protein n=1 Tax=Auriscalpium vulgare TaxID=40419 RepID=A0ACB8SCG2_9AGAM|nr:hypothetical protein FA95DRAFT_1601144 [Auriscalpium vulgare]
MEHINSFERLAITMRGFMEYLAQMNRLEKYWHKQRIAETLQRFEIHMHDAARVFGVT